MVKEEYKLNEKGLFDIYNYFKLLRIEYNLSQRIVCEHIGVNTSSLCLYENKERTPVHVNVLFKYCKLLGITEEIALELYKILCNRESNLSFTDFGYKIDKKGQIDEQELLNLGKFFYKERINRNIKQLDISEITGLSNAEISRVELLKREISTLNSIIPLCKFFNISDDDFLNYYKKIIGNDTQRSIYINSDIAFLKQTIESQRRIIQQQQETIEQLNNQLKLVKGNNLYYISKRID